MMAGSAPSVSGALGGLYPHLAPRTSAGDAERSARELDVALLEALQQKCRDSVQTKQSFFDEQAAPMLQAARLLAASFRQGGRLYTLGNGGSSCDAAHVAVEFQHPVTAGRPALPAHNLAQDIAMITAVGNDVGVQEVFARQMPGLVRPGDVALALSTSGNSANLVRGLQVAKSLGARTLALVGGDGGVLARSDFVDLALVVRSHSVHRVQETHVAIYHTLWDLVHSLLADDRRANAALTPARGSNAEAP
jgi:D-sedoheptulose 7-phosphate isomerase